MSARGPWSGLRGSRGFTLVELMVGLTIGMFLMIGLISLIVSTTTSRSELDKSTRQIENGRYALQLLRQDIQLAGFTGEMSTTSYAAQTPVICATSTADLKYSPSTSPGGSTVPMPIYGVATAPSCLLNAVANRPVLVVSRVDTTLVATLAAATASETYLQVSGCSNDTYPFAVSTATAAAAAASAASGVTFTLMKKDCTAANTAPLRKVIQHVYYLSSCNVCAPAPGADTTPTLKMAELVNGATVITPLVEGIEYMTFDYGIDMDGDGAPDCYVSNPASPPASETAVTVCPQPATPYDWTNATANWTNVMSVRVHVLARSDSPTAGWSDSRTYDLGLAASASALGDKYKRHVYSSVVRLYNGSGQRETP